MLKKIWLVHHTHMDIGYTDQPREVLAQQRGFLDRAVELCRADDAFRWTVESAYLVRDYLRHRPAAAGEALLDCFRSGRMELMAFEMQPFTELLDGAGLFEATRYATELGRRHGFPVRCAMLNDLGGYAARLPGALSASGVRYLVAGVGAFQVFLPWADLPHLFHLEDRSGARTLVWNLGIDRRRRPQEMQSLLAVYGLAANYIVLPYLRRFRLGADRAVEAEAHRDGAADDDPEEGYRRLAARLEAEGYPYGEVMLQYGGDNRWPSDFLPELIRRINAEGRLPPLELTTPGAFFARMIRRYGDRIPVRAGVLTDPWITRINPSPGPLATFRRAQRDAARARMLAARTERTDVDGLLEEAREPLALYADHTCGLSAWHTPEIADEALPPGDAAFEPLRESWRAKRGYAERAAALAAEAGERLRERLTAGVPGPAVLVFNHAARPMAGPVEVALGRDLAPLAALAAPDGAPVAWQAIGHNRYLVDAPSVPAGGMLALSARRGERIDHPRRPTPADRPVPETLVTDHFAITFDPATGSMRRLASADGRVRYDRPGEPPLEPRWACPEDYTLGWGAAGMTPVERVAWPGATTESARLLHDGPVATVIERRGHCGDALRFRLRLVCYRARPRLDVRLHLDKPARRRLESVFLAVPLAGRAAAWHLGQHVGRIDPDADLLPGAMRDCFHVARDAALRTDAFAAAMRSPDAPVLHPNRPALFRWDAARTYRGEPAGFHWQLYHNLLVTDAPAWQAIRRGFAFSLALAPDAAAAEEALAPADALQAVWHAGAAPGAAAEPYPEMACTRGARPLDVLPGRDGWRVLVENETGDALDVDVRLGARRARTSLAPWAVAWVPLVRAARPSARGGG